jgi:hypothetical protein
VIEVRLKLRICQTPTCPRYHKAEGPEAQGHFLLPQPEFGLDLIAQIGAWRYLQQRSGEEMQ